MSIRSIDVIVGGQFGSEAKGHVTQQVIKAHHTRRGSSAPVTNVRVAGPNAGHCVLDGEGKKFALRQIPVGVVDDRSRLFIAPGSEINPAVLANEISTIREGGHEVSNRLAIHAEATVLYPGHIEAEAGMHERMGSTGKGIGAARADRIMRAGKRVIDDKELVEWLHNEQILVINDDGMYSYMYDNRHVVIEGTQGYGLGLHAGYYPQCTSSDCRPIDFLGMAGLDPTMTSYYKPWVVARVFPIRVAGNSGPLKGETTWEDLGLPEELTTVTQKVRRVGEWDADLVNRAIRAAGPRTLVALTMFDQKCPETAGMNADVNTFYTEMDWPGDSLDQLRALTSTLNAYTALVTTGPDTGVWF